MITQQLIDYIKQQQQMGKSHEEIASVLHGQGWQQADIDQGFASAQSGAPAPMATGGELPKARQIFDEAWAFYKAKFNTLIIISIISTAAYFVIGFLIGYSGVGSETVELAETPILVGAGVGILALIAVAVWSYLAQVFVIKDGAENISWQEGFKRSKSKILPIITTGILVFLAVFGGAILLIIPGLIFAFWFSQSSYIVVTENLQNVEALKRSKHYVKGRVWPLFCKQFYIGIISLGVSLIAGILASIIESGALAAGASPSLAMGMNDAASLIVGLIWAPVALTYTFYLYKHLRETRP